MLHLSPFYGIVCARSNNAVDSKFSLQATGSVNRLIRFARAAEVHCCIVQHTSPLHHLTRGPRDFAFLVRRELITRHGLFDDVFAPGYFEEYDFCLRMNELGYSSILANRAMYSSIGTSSFEQILLRCYRRTIRY